MFMHLRQRTGTTQHVPGLANRNGPFAAGEAVLLSVAKSGAVPRGGLETLPAVWPCAVRSSAGTLWSEGGSSELPKLSPGTGRWEKRAEDASSDPTARVGQGPPGCGTGSFPAVTVTFMCRLDWAKGHPAAGRTLPLGVCEASPGTERRASWRTEQGCPLSRRG